MPPLPQNGTSYPPSTSNYQTLSTNDDEDLEAAPVLSSSYGEVRLRTFVYSPYRSQANNPTQLLQTFLADTRPQPPIVKDLSLRIRVHSSARVEKMIDLPLMQVSSVDGLPFGLYDDVPALRGLSSSGHGDETIVGTARRLVNFVVGQSSRTAQPNRALVKATGRLQVWNASQKKALYANQEEIDRLIFRNATGFHPPWVSLNSDLTASSDNAENHLHQTQPSRYDPQNMADKDQDDEFIDKFFSGSGDGESGSTMADFDLSTVFTRRRKLKSTRLVSIAIQEAFERFADDRHFSKRLLCRELVWGWDMARLKRSIADIVKDAMLANQTSITDKGKANARQVVDDDDDGASTKYASVNVEIEVTGLDSGLVYHVVWAPIPFLSKTCPGLFESRVTLLTLIGLSTLLLAMTVLRVLTNTLMIILGIASLAAWAGLMYLVQTRHTCVYDTVGTAYSLAPRWVQLPVDPRWDQDTVLQSIVSHGGGGKVEKRDKAWFCKKGFDQDEWLHLHRERLIHLIKS
ncbi:uncharacterized protein MEPE_01730 [Melanopsichium pennsylvanicum]|uniref:Uncharacterized protein n=2 Tax=Melanopsichium pennsylvanicum TaxID=63383 RepID=A0AAJ5C413_9BASI|nr:hypothetical protein BN887_06073 [Melanopsichium pennsylvanicum 4]SNX83024.1 uncharacterized protein MEPE_01730 [Melanopsichium pennsylvanicum]